jgi:hypothetical protein
MMKKYFQASVLAIMGLVLAGCNAAESGFNAPVGSSATFLTADVDLVFGGPGEIIILATLQVNIPINATAEAGNEIQGTITCAYCNLYVFKEGVTTFLPQTSLLDPVAANSFAFVTNKQGLYRFAVGVLSPADLGFINSDGDLVGYVDAVIADIGVAQTTLSIAGNPAE